MGEQGTGRARRSKSTIENPHAQWNEISSTNRRSIRPSAASPSGLFLRETDRENKIREKCEGSTRFYLIELLIRGPRFDGKSGALDFRGNRSRFIIAKFLFFFFFRVRGVNGSSLVGIGVSRGIEITNSLAEKKDTRSLFVKRGRRDNQLSVCRSFYLKRYVL